MCHVVIWLSKCWFIGLVCLDACVVRVFFLVIVDITLFMIVRDLVYLLIYHFFLFFFFIIIIIFFFFKQKTAYEIRPRDWSSDVCSSDLRWPSDWGRPPPARILGRHRRRRPRGYAHWCPQCPAQGYKRSHVARWTVVLSSSHRRRDRKSVV